MFRAARRASGLGSPFRVGSRSREWNTLGKACMGTRSASLTSTRGQALNPKPETLNPKPQSLNPGPPRPDFLAQPPKAWLPEWCKVPFAHIAKGINRIQIRCICIYIYIHSYIVILHTDLIYSGREYRHISLIVGLLRRISSSCSPNRP